MRRAILCVVSLLAVSCATSSLGRRQLKLFPESHLKMLGLAAFTKMVETQPLVSDPAVNAYVRCVVGALTRGPGAGGGWEARVFDDAAVNAFALPGGKIGVHRGLLLVADDQDQLATVIGHEMAHVLEGHANERVSAEFFATQLSGALATLANPSDPRHAILLEALGAGRQAGLLQYSRTHESEADLRGLDLMARAGFDPAASVRLWRTMAMISPSSKPELLSTHPAPETRIRELAARVPSATILRNQARAAGLRPACTPAQ